MNRSLSTLSTPRPLPSVTARSHGLLEAPRHADDGWILYSDALGGGVYRVPVSGDREPETVLPKRRGIGGLVTHHDGGIVVTGRGVVLAGALRFQPFAGEDPVPTEVWRITAPGVAEVAGVEVGAATV